MPKNVLVSGANGYIGNAVAQAFVRAGWHTYGLVRNPKTISALEANEIIPILGSTSDLSFLAVLYERVKTFDVIVSCTEELANYIPHYEEKVGLFRSLADTSNANGIRPLVLFTSGCKDYGQNGFHGDVGHRPHTEEDPIDPPDFVSDRAWNAPRIFEHLDLFDAVLLRPTLVYGRTSSYYGLVFDHAQAAASTGSLVFKTNPNTVMHGTHIDDVADAYVSLAEANRQKVAGKCYNIAAIKYDTLQDIGDAMVKEYGIKNSVSFQPRRSDQSFSYADRAVAYTQWVASERIRRDTGWTEKRKGFIEGLAAYRKAYEAAEEEGKMRTKAERSS